MSDAKCYFYSPVDGKIISNSDFHPCGPTTGGRHVPCCQYGTYCMAQGFCKSDIPPDSIFPEISLYFIGACTDPTGNDPACTQQCRNSASTYITNLHGQEWACCGNSKKDSADCAHPKGKRFFAVPASELATSTLLLNPSAVSSILETAEPSSVKNLGPGAFSSYLEDGGGKTASWFEALPTEVQSRIIPPSTNNNNSSSSSSSSNSSNHIGVYVGVPVGVVALIVLSVVAFLLLRHRRKTQRAELPSEQSPPDTANWDAKTAHYEQYPPAELPATQNPAELPPQYKSVELSGDSRPTEVSAMNSPVELPANLERHRTDSTLR